MQQPSVSAQMPWHDVQTAYAGSKAEEFWPTDHWNAKMDFTASYGEEQSYTWDHNNSLAVDPRYIPGSRVAPWSTYEMVNSVTQIQPSSEAVLFAFQADDNVAPRITPISSSHQQSESSTVSDTDDETIDRPPPGNPVGPPPQFFMRKNKQRSLNPAQRANAKLMRRKRACWNCALLKYPVKLPSLLVRKSVSSLTALCSVMLGRNAKSADASERLRQFGNAIEHTFLT